MPLDQDRCRRAVASRDPRFDGCFVVTVRGAGTYCRPSCPGTTTAPEHLAFWVTAAAAQLAGYRACPRCVPDVAPGSPEWDRRGDLAARAVRLIADGVAERDALAALLGCPAEQLDVVLTAELGADLPALVRAHRVRVARLLLEPAPVPPAEVVSSAAFASVRECEDAVRAVHGPMPGALRSGDAGTVALRLPFRTPLDRSWLRWHLAAHALTGVEDAADGYGRSLRLPHGPATVRLHLADEHVRCVLRLADLRDLGPAVQRVRRLLDLDADPVTIDGALSADPALAPSVAAAPGLRVPGAVDGGEVLLRTVLGQQVSLAAARTAGSRLVGALGEPLRLPDGGVTHLFPDPAVIADRGGEVLTGPRRRVESVRAVAAALAAGTLAVHPGRDAAALRAELLALPGVGPWTASYVVLRVLGDPDVLLDTDLVARKGAGLLGAPTSPAALRHHARRWAPWRSYAGAHLWRTALAGRGRMAP